MAAPRFDEPRIDRLLAQVTDELDGEWLLVGGAAVATWLSTGRTTENVDLIGLAGTQAERLALMDLASRAGLPIEAVNSAADYFVRRIEGWRDELVPLRRGPRATIHRPSVTLFLRLKAARLTAVDLDDCLAALAHGEATGEPADRARVLAHLARLPPTADAALAARRGALAAALGG